MAERPRQAQHRRAWRDRMGGIMRCAMCGIDEESTAARFDMDHVVPLEDGGPDELWNTQPLCRDCHVVKAALRSHRRHLAGLSARVSVDDAGDAAEPRRSPEDWWPLVVAKLGHDMPHIGAFLQGARIRQVTSTGHDAITILVLVPGTIGAAMLSRGEDVSAMREAWRSLTGIDCTVIYEPDPGFVEQ